MVGTGNLDMDYGDYELCTFAIQWLYDFISGMIQCLYDVSTMYIEAFGYYNACTNLVQYMDD